MRHVRAKKKTPSAKRTALVVRAPQNPPTRHLGRLLIGGRAYPCALGKAGITANKKEGDSATPRARMAVLAGRFRADRVKKPDGGELFWSRIDSDDGWCDAPFTPAYNRPVKLPHGASHELMTRTDQLYDRLIILDWNISTRAQGRGSAIFFHQARTMDGRLQGTEGCIALAPRIFEKLASQLARLRAVWVL